MIIKYKERLGQLGSNTTGQGEFFGKVADNHVVDGHVRSDSGYTSITPTQEMLQMLPPEYATHPGAVLGEEDNKGCLLPRGTR